MGYTQYNTEELWKMHIASPHESIRDELIKRYIGHTRMVAVAAWKKSFQESLLLDDVVSNAYYEMIKCFDRFDPHVGYSNEIDKRFTAYIGSRIKGSVYDLQEKYSMKVNRDVIIRCMDVDPNWLVSRDFMTEGVEEEFEYLWERVFEDNVFDLTKEQTDVLHMKYMGNLSYPMISEIMNIDAMRVSNIQKSAIAKIQRNIGKLSKFNVSPSISV